MASITLGTPVQSIAKSTPMPPVRSLIALTYEAGQQGRPVAGVTCNDTHYVTVGCILRIQDVGASELFGERQFVVVDIDSNDGLHVQIFCGHDRGA